jgi:hypothetical protein
MANMVNRMHADTSPSRNLDAPVLCEAYNYTSVDVMEVTIFGNLRSDLVTDLKLIHSVLKFRAYEGSRTPHVFHLR